MFTSAFMMDVPLRLTFMVCTNIAGKRASAVHLSGLAGHRPTLQPHASVR